MKRAYYSDTIQNFLATNPDVIVGQLSTHSGFALLQPQTNAWIEEIALLKRTISAYKGKIYFEYTIPRMGSASTFC